VKGNSPSRSTPAARRRRVRRVRVKQGIFELHVHPSARGNILFFPLPFLAAVVVVVVWMIVV
jgi:hypothetical protein